MRGTNLEDENIIITEDGFKIEAEVGLKETGHQEGHQDEIILRGEPLRTEVEKNLGDPLNQPRTGFWKRGREWKTL
jgi:hypothetical protein